MPRDFGVVRDPLWNNIRLDGPALAVLDTPAVQRLRYVRQLGHAFLVYPGATHSRFEHALGAYHLAREALAILRERGELKGLDAGDVTATALAALLHDVGHYPFSHALEEAGFPHHERLGAERLTEGPLGEALARLAPVDLAGRIGALIRGQSTSPLQGLISGTLDLDKIDYLSRDAWMCGVPYGAVDVDRLLAALTLVETERGLEVGVREKGISALESLLFAKYQMYRNVYWHHAVRAATCMFKRAVRQAVAAGRLETGMIAASTDGSLTEQLLAADPGGLARAVHERRLLKRAVDIPASEAPSDIQPWVWEDPGLVANAEDAWAAAVGVPAGELLIDYPARDNMLEVDLPLRTRGGAVERLTSEGTGTLGLPRIAGELYQSARRLRVFTRPGVSVPETLLDQLRWTEAEAVRRLGG